MAIERLGHYHLLEQIGAGGMGSVYRARDERLDRDVALKILHLSNADDQPGSRRRLLDEARSASQLNHPNICTIYEIGEESGIAFIAMELVGGKTLSDIIPPEGLAAEQVVNYGIQVADALAHAHQRRVVHRDLKPANVAVTADGHAKVLDFGLATRLPAEKIEEVTLSGATLTSSEAFAGTLPYMAPEQLRGEPADARSDIWALGVLLYEMASGHRPFTGGSGFELSSAILRDSPPALPAHISAALGAVIRKCMAKDPTARYQHAGEVRSALETLGSTATSIHEPPPALADAPRKSRKLPWIALTAIALVFLIVLILRGVDLKIWRSHANPEIRSIAVLPLANLSGDKSQDFFADGMTAELIGELSKISQLRVVSRTSAMSYKGTQTPLPRIARELNVNALLEGSVARSGDQVRISVGLYDGSSDRELWSETFERKMSEVLALQDEVAHAVAVKIRLKLSSEPNARQATTNPEAYELYLKGRYALDQGSEDQMKVALVYFRQGIEKDAHYAPLYAGLADAYARLPFYTDSRPSEAFPKSKEAAAKALQLDPALAEAHASMAYVMNYYDWDRDGAEQEFKHALELNPNDAAAHHAYGRFLASLGRVDEARAQLTRAQELDPLSLIIQVNSGMISYFARQYDDARERLLKVHELDPKFPVYWGIGMCYEQEKNYPEAIAQFTKGIELTGRGANGIASLAHAYGLAGQAPEAKKIFAELKDRSKTTYVSSYQFALIDLGLGQNDQAIAALQEAVSERSTLLGYLKMDPRFDPLRPDPRFQELMKQIHLP